MPNFVVLDIADVPAVGENTQAVTVYRVNATDEADACNQLALQRNLTVPHRWFVTQQNNIVRFVSTPSLSCNTTAG